MNECLKQLMMSLLRAYRFSPIIPDLGFQVPPAACFLHRVALCTTADQTLVSVPDPLSASDHRHPAPREIQEIPAQQRLISFSDSRFCFHDQFRTSSRLGQLSLTKVTFDVLRSVVFFYIKTPLRVKEAGLEELIPTTWWPTHFDKEVNRTGSSFQSA